MGLAPSTGLGSEDSQFQRPN